MTNENKQDAISAIAEVLNTATDKQLNAIRNILTVEVPGEEPNMEGITKKDNVYPLLQENSRRLTEIYQMLIELKLEFRLTRELIDSKTCKFKKQNGYKYSEQFVNGLEVKSEESEKKLAEPKKRFIIVPIDEKLSKLDNE